MSKFVLFKAVPLLLAFLLATSAAVLHIRGMLIAQSDSMTLCTQCCVDACAGNSSCVSMCQMGFMQQSVCGSTCMMGSAVCGDRNKTGTEECDDGNTVSNDGCSSSCKTEPLCNTMMPNCSDFPTNLDLNATGCKTVGCCSGPYASTTIAPLCKSPFLCDFDADASGKCVCPEGSTAPECSGGGMFAVPDFFCGDGIKNGDDKCDDGNENENDACKNDCTCGPLAPEFHQGKCVPRPACAVGEVLLQNSYTVDGETQWKQGNNPDNPLKCVKQGYCCMRKVMGVAYSPVIPNCISTTQQYTYKDSAKDPAEEYKQYGFQMCGSNEITQDSDCDEKCEDKHCPAISGPGNMGMITLPVCRTLDANRKLIGEEIPAQYSGRGGECSGYACLGEIVDGVLSCGFGKGINCGRCELMPVEWDPQDPDVIANNITIEEFQGCMCDNPDLNDCRAEWCEKDANDKYTGACNTPCAGENPGGLAPDPEPADSVDCYVLVNGRRVKRGIFGGDLECRDMGDHSTCMPPGPGGPYGGGQGGTLGGLNNSSLGGGGMGPTQTSQAANGAGGAAGAGAAGGTGDDQKKSGGGTSIRSLSPFGGPSRSSQNRFPPVDDAPSGSFPSSAAQSSGVNGSEAPGKYLACQGAACVLVDGTGPDECDSVLGCGVEAHAVCENNQCMGYDGPGANECSTAIACGTHTECRGSACVSVLGVGSNACATPEDCLSSSSSFSSQPVSSAFSSVTIIGQNSVASAASNSVPVGDVFYSAGVSAAPPMFAVSVPSSVAFVQNFSSFVSVSGVSVQSISSFSRLSVIPVLPVTIISSSSSYSSSSSRAGLRLELLSCGNFILDPGELCDDGNANAGDGCDMQCQREDKKGTPIDLRLCGNHIVDRGEECDDGNRVSGEGCSTLCAYEERTQAPLVAAASLCGNGLLESPEECDDSNRRSGDGCNDSCLLEIGICGDGKVQQLLGEQCESSLHDPSLLYGCRNCRFFSVSCGDGKLDPGEECDKGNLNSTSPNADCRPDCSLSRCGDGILDSTELCDDGNRRAGDGCDSFCKKETTLVASDNAEDSKIQIPNSNNGATQQLSNQQQIPFPYTQSQPYPYAQLPFASLQPLMQQMPTTTQSGPAAVAVIGAGAAAGLSWVRRRRK